MTLFRRQIYQQLAGEAGHRPPSVNSNSKFSSINRNGPVRSSHNSLQEREAGTVRSSHSSLNTGQEREPASVPTSPSKSSTVLHCRSASQPVRSEPPPPDKPLLARKSSFRSSMPGPLGKPPLPHSHLAKSPTDLALSSRAAVTVEPGLKSRLNTLGVAEAGKNWQESLKSQTSTVSHGSTGSKISSTSSQVSTWAGPRDPALPDTENPDLLRNLDFISPKAGVYRPVNTTGARTGKKDKCSLM